VPTCTTCAPKSHVGRSIVHPKQPLRENHPQAVVPA
jgi:hypothetical protein